MDQAAWKTALGAARACIGCGACMQVCPVYRVGRREELSARGKLRLLQGLAQGPLPASRHLAEVLSRCLLCGRCSQHCPNQVPAMEGLRAGREVLASVAGAPLLTRLLLEEALPRPRRLNLLAMAGGLALPLLSGLRLKLGGLEPSACLPPLSQRPFLDTAPREVPGPAGSPRLGFFVGCVANYLRPGLARRALRLLRRVATVVIPPQGCCGLAAVGAGLSATARDLLSANLRAFTQARVDKVVTACGSCAYALAKELPRLLDTPQAQALAGSVLEISQVLVEHPRLLAGLGHERRPVAVHDPCHLKMGLKVHEEPRQMLRQSGLDLVEMESADACCGGGGLFAVNQPGHSQDILAPRLLDFERSGAGVLATSCGGCHLQWRGGLPAGRQVVHPLELLTVPQS
ncbi:MAG: (Fe-S)-binding protein [Desulfarculus sp.]|nr:(Fe-S)-binding protein [Desulfarculus sp.]